MADVQHAAAPRIVGDIRGMADKNDLDVRRVSLVVSARRVSECVTGLVQIVRTGIAALSGFGIFHGEKQAESAALTYTRTSHIPSRMNGFLVRSCRTSVI